MAKKMPEIVPAILVKTAEELDRRIDEVEQFVNRIHIDIMDGKFVPNTTIQPEQVKNIKTDKILEAHLMVEDCERYVNNFLKLNFDVIIVHVESCKEIKKIIDIVKRKNKKIGLSINPSTSLENVKKFLNDIDMVLFMTVNPGSDGQEFMPEILPKIEEVRKISDIDIEVDGGIKVGTIKLAVGVGANLLASNSGIYKFEDKKKAIEILKKEAMDAVQN